MKETTTKTLPRLCLLCEHAVGLEGSGKPFFCSHSNVPLSHRLRDVPCFEPIRTTISYAISPMYFPDGTAARRPWPQMVDQLLWIADQPQMQRGIVGVRYDNGRASIHLSLDVCGNDAFWNCNYYTERARGRVLRHTATQDVGELEAFLRKFENEEAFQNYLRREMAARRQSLLGKPGAA